MTASNLAKVPSSHLASPPEASVVEMVLTGGDLSKLTSAQRVSYLNALCESLGLNPLTRPFELLQLNGKWVVYARRDCTDQLRKIHKVSVRVVSRENVNDLLVVTTQATTPDGRVDESIGAVSIAGLRGENLANAMMKADTKAKRRVTLSICGLGFVDESEVESIPGAKVAQFSQELPRIDPHDDGADYSAADDSSFHPLLDQLHRCEALLEQCDSYDKTLALRTILGSKAKQSELTKAIQAAKEARLITPEQHKELSRIWQKVNRQVEKLEVSLKPDAAASFIDPEPEADPADAYDRSL